MRGWRGYIADMPRNITVIVQTPIGEVHAECLVTPAAREWFRGGMPATDPPDPGEAEIVGDVWIVMWRTIAGRKTLIKEPIDDHAAILFWTPIMRQLASAGPEQQKFERSTDRRDIRNYTSLETMILDKAMEEA